MTPVPEGAGVTTGEGGLAGMGVEAEGVPAGDAELPGVVPVAGVGVVAGLVLAVGLGVVADGDRVGAGEAEDGVVAGVTPTVAAGGGLMSR
jgi:hypothetical protein